MRKIIKHFLNVLYPRCCPVCHEILADQNRLICERCERELQPVKHPRCFKCGKPVEEGEEYCLDCRSHPHIFTQGRGIFLYDERMRRSITRYKYYGCREYGYFYGRAMCRYGRDEIERWKPDLIVPVPLHKSKERSRGFNQSAVLAEVLSRFTGIPSDCMLVRKVVRTRSQKKLTAHQRQENLKKAFCVTKPVKGRKILVVDDVYTTGSTMDAMASCLMEKGAENVYFLTVCIGKR